MLKKGLIILSILVAILFILIIFSLNEMAIEDKYGEFYELYDKIDSDENYMISINDNEYGFVEKLEDIIFVDVNGCYRFILEYLNMKIEIYKFDVNQTYSTFGKVEFNKLKKEKGTKLIYKN